MIQEAHGAPNYDSFEINSPKFLDILVFRDRALKLLSLTLSEL